MQFATVLTDETTSAAVLVADTWHRLDAPDLSSLLRSDADLTPGEALPEARPTLPFPDPGKVICCGLNYADHIVETGRDLPTHPTLFAKYADTLIGPGDQICAPTGTEVDWEAELVVVIGREIRAANRDQASQAIAGYTIANDISIRDWQRRTLQWFQGKAWDATTPIGPVMISADALDPSAGVEVSCRVNGVERQRGNTATLVFDCADLVAYVSTFTTLRPGDLILTGTPGGVGMGMSPPVYLADGDVVETEITGIGTLTNTVRLVDPAATPAHA